jgi:hypothetical protein
MPSPTSTIAPAGRTHAIVHVLFAIELSSPLDSSHLRQLDAQHTKVKDDLPRRARGQGIIVHMGTQAGEIEQAASPDIASLTFDRLAPDGTVIRALRAHGNVLQVFQTEYARWGPTWEYAHSLFALALPIVIGDRSVTALMLQYLDRFTYIGDYNAFRADMIFDTNSSLLARHVFGRSLNWHSHTGYLDEIAGPPGYRRLDQINVDVLDDQTSGGPIVNILLNHIARLHTPCTGDALFDLDTTGVPLISALMAELHNADKAALSDLLNDDMSLRIGLQQ